MTDPRTPHPHHASGGLAAVPSEPFPAAVRVGPPASTPDPGHASPYGREPGSGLPYSEKSRVAAGLLQIFFGAFGVGRFYLGHNKIGLTFVLLTVTGLLTFFFFVGVFLVAGAAVWGLVDGFVILTSRTVDASGRPLRP